jgi:hypothetical protein
MEEGGQGVVNLNLPSPGTYQADRKPEIGRTGARRKPSKIMLNLLILDAIRPRGVKLSQRLIADVCGCSNAFIYLITTQALAKMRREAQRRNLEEERQS